MSCHQKLLIWRLVSLNFFFIILNIFSYFQNIRFKGHPLVLIHGHIHQNTMDGGDIYLLLVKQNNIKKLNLIEEKNVKSIIII